MFKNVLSKIFKEEEKSIVVWDYFELKRPTYVYIKITPHSSIRNYNSINICKAIKLTYKSISDRLKREQKKLFFETNFKISYVVDIYKENAEFYFIIPKYYKSLILEKIKEIWSKATIEEVENIKKHSNDAEIYELAYKKEDALSLNTERKSNEPLNSILNVMEIMKEEDRVTIIYNFLPRSNFGWDKMYKDTIDKLRQHKPILREKFSGKYVALSLASGLLGLIDSITEILNDMLGNTSEKRQNLSLLEAVATALDTKDELSLATKKKKDASVLDVQVAIITESKDKVRKENNAISVCNGYRTLDQDNELIYQKSKTKKFDLEDYRIQDVEINTMSVEEAQNFIQLPGKSILEDLKIKHVNVNENSVPEELRQGTKCLGTVKCKGNNQEAYLENEYNVGSLPLLLIGSQGGGKTTYISNYAKNCSDAGESVILIDFIKNCELSETVKSVVPKEKLIEIDLASEEGIQGLGYNEIVIENNMSVFNKLKLANLQAQQILNLVDAISTGDPLSSRMRRFLNSAANIVFVQGHSSVKNVIECLENYKKRADYIKKLSPEITKMLEDEISSLGELDETDKKSGEVIGTKESKIEHILDRVSLLREDFKLKYMFNKNLKENINLVDCMKNGKIVLIKMKESDFQGQMIKNILVTYWVSKVWLSSQLRGAIEDKPLRSNIIIDEVFQSKKSLSMLEYILPQSRKFGCKFVFSTQYTKQLESIFSTLEASGASYMLLRGSTENDFNHFSSKLDNFEYEDLKNMEEFHSLNLVYYSKGYSSFISKLPYKIR